jgi:hypothetical protein
MNENFTSSELQVSLRLIHQPVVAFFVVERSIVSFIADFSFALLDIFDRELAGLIR